MRAATADDLAVLVWLERAASSAGLGHIFGPDIPFPDGDVLARWALVLEEPGIVVVIDEVDGVPVGYAAFGDGWLRHLGVIPELWGTGRGQALHDYAVAGLDAGGGRPFSLWVLVENHRARAFYRRLGWVETDVREVEVFVPYPIKMRLELPPLPSAVVG
jgi:GNAT superfamily N-acetyltransferase